MRIRLYTAFLVTICSYGGYSYGKSHVRLYKKSRGAGLS